MRYDISKPKAPEMPNLGKGTKCIKFTFSQASKNMQKPLFLMHFPPKTNPNFIQNKRPLCPKQTTILPKVNPYFA